MLFIAIWFETHRRRHRGAFIESLGIISDRIELYFSTIPKFHAQSVINVLQLTCPVHVILHEDPLLPTSGCRTQATTGYDVVDKQAFTLNWSTLGVYFTTFLFQRADCSLNSRKWMSRVLLLRLVIEWTNRIVSRTYSDVSFHQFRILLVCLFVFQLNYCRRGPLLLDFWLQQKNTHKTSLLFRTTRHIIISLYLDDDE